MFKIDLEVSIDKVEYHVHKCNPIDLHGTVIMNGVEDIEEMAVRALRQAFEQYYKSVHAISSDGP